LPEASVNDPQKRRVAATFQHVDELLRTAAQALASEEAASPFDELIRDASLEQQGALLKGARQVRDRMIGAMQRLQIPIPAPSIPATRSARTYLMFAEVDLEDIDPKRFGGYGSLSAEDAGTLEEICSELLAILVPLRLALEDRGHPQAGPASEEAR
jgi:hypothetical protein